MIKIKISFTIKGLVVIAIIISDKAVIITRYLRKGRNVNVVTSCGPTHLLEQ